MSKSRYLLDTSAVLTLLEDVGGTERVETLLHQEQVLLLFLVLLETYYTSLRERSEAIADWRYALLKQPP